MIIDEHTDNMRRTVLFSTGGKLADVMPIPWCSTHRTSPAPYSEQCEHGPSGCDIQVQLLAILNRPGTEPTP